MPQEIYVIANPDPTVIYAVTAEQGPPGTTGAAGAAGSVWRDGAGVPSNGLGVNGDYYLNETNGDYYKKTAGAYVLEGNIKGPAGADGASDWAEITDIPANLTALAAYNTNGFLVQTAANTFVGRSIAGTSNRVAVSNGNGVSGNPTIDIDAAYVGQTSIVTVGQIGTGEWKATTIGSQYGGTGADFSASSGILKYASGVASLVTAPSGALVGDTDVQTLTNKSLTSPALTGTPTTSTAAFSTNTTQIASTAFVQTAVSSAVVGLLDDRGNYDASGNVFPSSGGSGTAGAVLKGDLWTISVAGTLGGHPVTAGDVIRALIDTPAQTDANWAITENNLGYVPLNAALADGAIYIGNSGGVGTARTPSGDWTISNLGVATLATVNGSPNSFGSVSTSLSATVNAKGLITALSSQAIAIAESQVTNLTTDLAGKANLALSNLVSVSINASLIPQSAKDLGATATPWRDIYLGNGTFGSHSIKLTGTPTGNRTVTFPNADTIVAISAQQITWAGLTAARTITFPDASDTVAMLGQIQTFSAVQTFTANPIISNTAPGVRLLDSTASAKSLDIVVDANIANFREIAGASGSLLTLDLANNRVGIGTLATAPGALLSVGTGAFPFQVLSTGQVAMGNNHGGPDTAAAMKASLAVWITNANMLVFGSQAGSPLTNNIYQSIKGDLGGNDLTLATYQHYIFQTLTNGAGVGTEVARIQQDGKLGLGTTAPAARLHARLNDAVTNAVATIAIFDKDGTTITPAPNFGGEILGRAKSSITSGQNVMALDWYWNVATHASRQGESCWHVYDTAKRTAIVIRASGSAAMIGLFGVSPVIQPAGANQAALTDSTTGTPGFTLSDVGLVFSQAVINNNFASLARLVDNLRTALVSVGIAKGSA